MVVICRVCQKQPSRYTCPRCETAYCSLECYKRHSERCTEGFYRAQVEGELQGTKATGEERKRLEQMVLQLSRLGEDEDGDEASDEEEGSDRLEALVEAAMKGELSLDQLSEEEIERFHAEVKSGSLGRALGAWEPWWERAAVLELDELDDAAASLPREHAGCEAARRASPLVAFTVLEALYAYAHGMRAFNGDWQWDPLRVASHLLHVAKAVAGQKVHQSARECLSFALSAAAALPGGGFGSPLDLHCLRDLALLLQRRGDSLERALGEFAEIVERARAVAAADAASARALNGLLRSAKKLEFLAAFAWHHEEHCAALAKEVLAFEASQVEALQAAQRLEEQRRHEGLMLRALD